MAVFSALFRRRDALRDALDAQFATPSTLCAMRRRTVRDAFDSVRDALRDVYVGGVSRVVGNTMRKSRNFVTKMS